MIRCQDRVRKCDCVSYRSGSERRREREKKPLKILTNSHWPVRQRILCNLSFSDKRALAQAIPGLEIQEDVSYKRQERQELVNTVVIFSKPVTLYCFHCFHHSHFGHPLLKAIVEKQWPVKWSGGSEQLAEKTEEINQYIANISEDINEIPSIGTELCLTVAPRCWIRGYTALHVAAMCNDVETARSLIEQGHDMYRLGGDKKLNCLHEAVLSFSVNIVRFLVTEVNMDKGRRTGDTEDEDTDDASAESTGPKDPYSVHPKLDNL